MDAIVEEVKIKASAERIFRALVSPGERLKWWWRSEGKFELTAVESDLRPGGQWTMRGLGYGGRPLTITGTYREVDPPNVLSFTWLPDWQEDKAETLLRWELFEQDGMTTLRLTHTGFTTEASRATYRGWPLILGSLQAYLKEQQPMRQY